MNNHQTPTKQQEILVGNKSVCENHVFYANKQCTSTAGTVGWVFLGSGYTRFTETVFYIKFIRALGDILINYNWLFQLFDTKM